VAASAASGLRCCCRREALQALRAAWDGVDDAIHASALRVLNFDWWYANSAGLKGLDMVQLWLKEEEYALAEGYNGLRTVGRHELPQAGRLGRHS
jgi:hypothetical protein